MTVIISGIDLKNHWNLTRDADGKWTARLADPAVPDTGVEIASSFDVDLLIEKLEIFEQGQASAK